MNAIFSQVVDQRVQELRKEKCCGCEIDHPSQRRHDCLMMSDEEGWIIHGLESVEDVFQKETLQKQFAEACRIMKLPPHEHVLQHFHRLKSNHVASLEFMMDLKFKENLPEYQDILGYLYYWQEEH